MGKHLQLAQDLCAGQVYEPESEKRMNAGFHANSLERAILDLKTQRDKIQQYRKRITRLTDRETQIARECLARGQRGKALLALRNKKFQESLLQKTDLQLEQLQRLTSEVEFASIQKDVLYGLKQGTAALKMIHDEMGGIENVEKLLGENAEARAYQKEIGEMLGGQLSNADEDEVQIELEAMQREMVGSLPDVPTVEIKPPEGETAAEQLRRSARAGTQARRAEEPMAA
jgi:charged multivesicular body protein 6